MRLLFSVNNFGFLRNFEPALRQLAARGHDLHLLAERRDSVGGTRTIENLQREHPDRVTWSYAPSRKDDFWQPLAVTVRRCLDYWRYLDGRYDRAQSLRARAATQAPAFASRLPQIPVIGSRPALRLWRRLFQSIERAMPPGDVAEGVLRDLRPDLLLLTPLLYFGSQQVEYVRAARALGIRSVLGVGSWDHLTTKGLIHEQPDRVVVWNEMQRGEAADLHGIPPERVTVTGAQAYDHWFTQTPATTRDGFCAKVGVPADRPLLLYLCSSPFITPYEVGFVRRWIAAIRDSSYTEVRRAAILIRPHPQNADQWRDVDPSLDEALGIWPRAGANPVDADARADYYDSMFHSVAVVGVNTSALIESGIVGRPVLTVLADEFAGQQDGTLHFQHLKNVHGGLLQVGATLDEHVAQLSSAIAGRHGGATGREFIKAFIRPHGLDVPAAGRFADVIEQDASTPRLAPVRQPLSAHVRRAVLHPVAAAVRAARPRRKSPQRDKDAGSSAPSRLRIMFVLSSPEYLRYFDSTMRLLVTRGHSVSVAVNWLRERKNARLADLVGDPGIAILGALPKRADVWVPFARALRGTMDFVRYLHPRFADTPALRARIHRKVLPPVLRPLDRIRSLSEPTLARVIRWMQACERAIPVSVRLRRFVETARPDVVVVSPLVDAASDQVDTVRAAHAVGVPVVAAIASWDNLTNKGLMRVEPDLVTVWNDIQKEEAIALHGVRPERVAVTGAQLFDRWFDRQPSQNREAFCRQVGLPRDEPFVLFTGSSVFIARSEVEVPFVRRWIEALRASTDPRLRTIPVLVRPHPFNCDAWADTDFPDLGAVAVWPRRRYTPAAEDARASFFDSLYHSAAVVGINTSAMLEAAILLKPVFSVLAPEFAGTQEGTIHFRYMLPENGGFLRVATSIDDHVAQLSDVLRAPESVREQTELFVKGFVRPQGLEVPCTPVLAGRIEGVGFEGYLTPEPDTVGSRLLRAVLLPIAMLVKWLHLGEDLPALSRRKLYSVWSRLGRNTRVVLKRVVLRPGRLAIWAIGITVKRLRRMFRVARHRVAVTFRLKPEATRLKPEATRPLRILFSMRNFWYVKLFDSVIRELASRGHYVHILAERGEHNERSRDWNDAAAALAEEHPTVTFAWAPRQVEDDWADLRVMIRLGLDHLRFLEPEYADAPMLGLRARRRTPRSIVRLADMPGFRSRPGRWLIAAALKAAERAVPTGPQLADCIGSHHADAILVTPLLTLGSEQVDVVRTARHLGVPTALCVGSWDHLSSKALIRQWPDRVLVWNETQKREATSLHDVPADRVVVTGAQCFDQWFDRRPSLDRVAFCKKVGLDSARPIILYVCSALFEGSPNEAEFALRWVSALRSSSDAGLRNAGILVRPHPKRGFEWDNVTLAGLENVSLWPPRATAPFDVESKGDYFDSMFHSAAIAGLNTSALIEGGIVGRPVHTVLLPEFYESQEGTLHFRYLLKGGLLRSAPDLPTHVRQLAASLGDHDPAMHHNRAFIESFVRPGGLSHASTPLFADAVEHLAQLRTHPQREPVWAPALRVALTPVARWTSGTFADQIGRERRRLEKARARTERVSALQDQRAREKALVLEERRLKHEAIAREREERLSRERAEKLQAKEELRAAKRRAKEARVAQTRRRKRRAAFHERVSGYLRRVTHPFSASR